MMKFSALNESSLSDDNGDPELATREAQEEEAYSLYHLALKKQSEGEVEESENMLKQILEMEFLAQAHPNEEDEDEDQDGGEEAPIRPALTLKYLLYKNLATIANGRKDFQSAVAFFLDALEIDNTDVMMWYQMGKASINIANYSLARLCFEEGLKCNPNHWPCLDNVITVMYTLNDYANCLYYIAQALERECYYLKGLAFKDEIYREDPSLRSFCEDYFKRCDSSIHYVEYDKEEAKQFIQESLDMRVKKQSFYKPAPLPVLTLSQPITEKTWKNLGESLINMYQCIKMANPSISYSCKIDLSPYMDSPSGKGPAEADKLSSPASSLSEACSSNSAIAVPPAAAVPTPEGLLQLATIPSDYQGCRSSVIEVNPVEMEVDEMPAASPYNLVLTPVEVQPTDLSIGNDSTSSNRRTSKRKRLLSELTDLSAKRRSSRVRNPAVKKPQDNINYQELLQKFLPAKLIGNGKCDDPDDDSEPVSLDKACGDLSCGQSSENEKSDKTTPDSGDLMWSEKEDVAQFISGNQNNSGIIDLLYKYVVMLGQKSSCLWPKTLIDVFCEAFSRLRSHITTPNLFSQSSDPDRMKEISLAILCYCEFKVDKWYLSTGHSMSFSPKSCSGTSAFQSVHNSIGNDFHSDMEFLVMLTARRDVLEKDWLDFSARALWLKAKFHSLEGEIDLAVCCMGKLNDILIEENDVKITVHNCGFSNIIASEKVQQQLESLQRCQSLEEVQRLYEHCDYASVVNLLVLTFNQPRTKRKQPLEGVPERHAQLLLLQNSLWKLERYKECVYWSEVSFNEALQQFMNAARSDWSETMAQLLNGLYNCVKLDTRYLSELEESKLVRLTQNLILVIVIQMENYDFSADNASLLIVLPWMLLYRLILNEEKRSNAPKKAVKVAVVETGSAGNSSNKMGAVSFLSDFDLSSSMPSSLMLLFTAHEYLGRRSWCTFADGQLLLHNIDVMMTELQDTSGNSYLYREDLETGLEQCIYCLYGHPNKRTRAKHLQEHNSKQLTLTWERAILIFQYFKPNVLPEFDSYRTSTVSAELESLLKRIIALVPPEEDPTTRVDSYTAYIEGVNDKCPEPPFRDKTLSAMVKDLYYLLGDYYFKNKEFSKAIRFYLMDICINPDRQDSWAGMALSRSSQLDQKLNSYELRNESTIYRKSSAALKCFEHALELDPTTTSLWIEHGSLAYILHSHASRQLKQESACEELHDLLRKKKLEMLQVAERCFGSANRCEEGVEPEEAWLHHYMLGKICEKKGERPDVYLEHYQKALMYLHEDFARYPMKIQYHNPAELSIEALEVYYRVHASILKFLWKHENKGVDLATLKVVRRCLMEIAMSPFAKYKEKCKKEEVSCSSTPHSDLEELIVEPPAPVKTTSNVDHNYYDKVPQDITDSAVKRQSRPSIDSSPETQDSGAVKEVMQSLVGVVTERFVDEASEKEKGPESSGARILKKIMVESVGEQSVYTTKSVIEQSAVATKSVHSADQELVTKENIEEIAVKSIALECEKVVTPSPPEITPDETSDAIVPDRAMELETEAAASLLVEEMRLESNALGDTDYCDFEPYCVAAQKQEDQESAYYDCVMYVDGNEVNSREIPREEDPEVRSVISGVLESLEGEKISSDTNGVEDNVAVVTISATDESVGGDCVEMKDVRSSKIEVQSSESEVDRKKAQEDAEMEVDVEERSEVEPLKVEKEVMEMPISKSLEGFSSACNAAEKRTVVEDVNVPMTTVVDDSKEKQYGERIALDCEVEQVVPVKTKEAEASEVSRANTTEVTNTEVASKDKTSDAKASKLETQESGSVSKVPPASERKGAKDVARSRPSSRELKQSQVEIASLIPLCMDAMREVLFRFIQHYKSLYRMAHYYCHSTRNKNLQWAREILLAATPPSKKYVAMPGLFADRKNANFFNGIWRAPSNEIDRPGSFGAHMYRSVTLLIEVLTQQKDYNMLVFLTQQLYRTPDLGKKYMRDTDRVSLVRSSYDSCVDILRDQMNRLLQEEPPPEESRLVCCLLEVYRACQALLRAGIYVDETNDLLEETYTMYRFGEVDDHPSVLEQATKFCQLQLGKSYPQSVYELNKSSSKYLGVSDAADINPSANAYAADAWQKEYAKSLMAPVTSCNAKPIKATKREIETTVVPEPVILIPIDSSKFAGSLVPTKMVHVEKPKAENLQACSLAYLPVTPVFPKDGQGTSLVSCQAFECFSVLKSIMQASGYQVAPPGQVQDAAVTPVNLVKPRTEIPNFKPGVGRPRKRRRRARMEALNLCKRINLAPVPNCIANPINTKPIVSSSIANSIAELKVGNIRSSPKRPTAEVTKTSPSDTFRDVPHSKTIATGSGSSSLCRSFASQTQSVVEVLPVASSDVGHPVTDAHRSKGLITDSSSLRSGSASQIQPVLPVATTSSAKIDDNVPKNSLYTSDLEKVPTCLMADINDDSSASTHIDASVIEQCAREMLEFINQKVEHMVLNTKPPVDFSNLRVRAAEYLKANSDNKNGFAGIRNVDDTKSRSNVPLELAVNEQEEKKMAVSDKETIENAGVSNRNSGNGIKKFAQQRNDASDKELNDRSEELENLESKTNAMTEDADQNNEEDSDTLDADEIKDDSSTDLGPKEPNTFSDIENQLEVLKDDAPSSEIRPLESCDLSKDSSTEFAVCSPKPTDPEEDDTK